VRTILVTGATGNVGSSLVAELADRGVAARAFVRDPDRAAAVLGPDVELAALGAAPGSPVAFWDWHARIERHLEASGVPAVVLRPRYYMTNLLGFVETIGSAGAVFAPPRASRSRCSTRGTWPRPPPPC
jgi:uncharacterized protein YbjT (DUF2867 family)